ncbi:glutamate receptor ionotropic, delta-1 [Zeugodacus cucurbitae]|uniref:glutamate receptor ionotropic, delta-1 n=1 Tax=Zeugodacus cucurbitae TaxID=28588 RepID=UPI0010A73F4E|nr:glutamate receptor ionotropic, delta-1 [Zeugodacus cucurbitae]
MDIILGGLGKGGFEKTGNHTLVMALAWAILNAYGKFTSTPLVIAKYANKPQNYAYQAELIEALLVHLQGRHYRLYIVEQETRFDNSTSAVGWGGLAVAGVWFVDSWQSFEALVMDLEEPKSTYKRSGWFILVYTGSEVERLKTVKSIFTRLFGLFVLHVNVFLLMDTTAVAYTYFPFTPTTCHSAKPKLLLSFRNNRPRFRTKGQEMFFPYKLRNLHGCELSIVTWHEPPFIILDQDRESGRIKSIEGIEGLLITILAKIMNFTIRVVDPQPRDRGAIFANGTLTGVTKMIAEGNANITIIYTMYEKKRAQVMDATFSYMSFPLMVAIPHGRPLSPLQRLLRPFRFIIWSLIASNIVLAVLIIYALKFLGSSQLVSFVFGSSNRIPFSNLWASLYGNVIHSRLPYRNFSRYLLGLWLLCTLVLRSAYSGQLFIMLQDGRALTPLKSFDEIVEHNYTVNTAPVLTELLSSVLGDASIGYIDGAKNTMPMILKRIAHGSKEALTIIEPALLYFNYQQDTEDERVAILPQKLIMTPLTMYMPKHSFLVWPFNTIILYCIDVGIIDKFERSYRLVNQIGESQEPVKLSLFLLLGIFSLYGALMLLCILIFLLELWAVRSPLTKMVLDFLNY